MPNYAFQCKKCSELFEVLESVKEHDQHNEPLVWWIWFAGVLLVIGGVIVMWPGGGPTRRSPRRSIAGYNVKLVGEREKAAV